MRNVRVRPVIATLLLATALTTFGCMRSPKGETIMADKPSRASVVLRDAQEEVKSPKRMLDAVPVLQKKEEVKEETKKEEFAPRKATLKEKPKRIGPRLQ